MSPMSDRDLPVTLYGIHIGELARTGGGGTLFRWSDDAEERWGFNSPVLSRSLRVGFSNVARTESFFGALLPEGQNLVNLAREVKVASNDLLGILEKVGADLAGALRVGSAHEATESENLTGDEVDALLANASGFLVGGGGSALPGFQRKLTLTRGADGTWLRGNGTIPSTHILKPVVEDYRTAVENENYTLGLAREVGLLGFDSWVEKIGRHTVLVIERYDRERDGSSIARIHQEDGAQALGLSWGGDAKFERDDSRSSLRSLAELLDTQRTVFAPYRPDAEMLLRYTTFNVAAGNTDAHAKNFSFLHDANGGTRLAPLYDVTPLALRYDVDRTMAMKVNGVHCQPDITVDDLVAEAEEWGLPESSSRAIVEELLERLVEATRQLDADASIRSHTPGYIRGQAQNLAAGKPAGIISSEPLMMQKSHP
ncbi:type II toxin-antitoxin system HipA family toxin [Cryobacterium mannosilyticum]|uniref:Type II toxin-antitoxin system HipA family toxin n=2 Tax=Cryobacterium mannosilyticum TaxID=1259190 RepID=A0A4R8WBM3_9MICO|nr:type II toxin-antitoxin system HipA family toxin [Cryobacterium mannosilyticum]